MFIFWAAHYINMAKRRKTVKHRESKMLLLAEEQVVLSKERTILQFMSTAITLIGLGLVVVNVLKELLFQVIGFGLIFIGFIELLESLRKLRVKQQLISQIKKKTRI